MARAVFVHMPSAEAGQQAPYQAGTRAVIGTLEIGAQREANHRASYIRLLLDPVRP